MFKASDQQTGTEINILDPRWDGSVDRLRTLGRQDQLVCPGCHQAVRVRVPSSRRRHFAHKHLQNCALAQQSPILLEARALLYQTLVGHFDQTATTATVEIEKQVAGLELPRPIDCWVQTVRGSFAYWIIHQRMQPQDRGQLQHSLATLGAPIHWILLSELHQEDPIHTGSLYLSTTEREFAQTSSFDTNPSGAAGKTLHYLDPEQSDLTTYRGLTLIHAPQLYRGRSTRHRLNEIHFSPTNGEVSHPGEDAHRARVQLAHQRQAAAIEQRAREAAAFLQQSFHAVEADPAPPPATSAETPKPSQPGPTSGVKVPCVFCRQITADYWYLNQAEQTCKCRTCYRQGRW